MGAAPRYASTTRSLNGTARQVRQWSAGPSKGATCVTVPDTILTLQLSHCPVRQPLGRRMPAASAAVSRVPASGTQR